MAFWRKQGSELQEMYRTLQQSPGLSPTELARRLQVAPSTVQRRLPNMEEAGYLLSEDQKGGLWPYGDGNE